MGYNIVIGGCSSAWLERLPVEQNVGGSNPLSHPKCPCSLTDKVPVFGTGDGGSIPSKGARCIKKLRKIDCD